MPTIREFRPELMSRKGEWLAWVVGLGLILALILGSDRWGSLPVIYWLASGFIVFSAMSISLGNWLDRRSVIRVEADGIAFENGLRSVRLGWSEVQNVAVIPTRFGRRVQVQGAQSHFTFKTMSQSSFGSEVMRMGFADGQAILETILEECRMQMKVEKDGLVYYARA